MKWNQPPSYISSPLKPLEEEDKTSFSFRVSQTLAKASTSSPTHSIGIEGKSLLRPLLDGVQLNYDAYITNGLIFPHNEISGSISKIF